MDKIFIAFFEKIRYNDNINHSEQQAQVSAAAPVGAKRVPLAHSTCG